MSRIAGIAFGLTALACRSGTAPSAVTPLGFGMQPSISATSSVSGSPGNEVLDVAVTITNTDVSPHSLTLREPCLLLLHLYTSPARTGTPVYADEFAPGGCKYMLITDTLAAHASVTYRSSTTPVVNSALMPAGRLPPGRYYAAVSVGVLELPTAVNGVPLDDVVLGAP